MLLTVLFTDIVDSTRHLDRLGDRGWRELLAEHDRLVAEAVTRLRGREIDHAGDGVFATFDGPARAILCASEILRNVRSLGLEVRAGVHTGECELAGERVAGIAVHLGARIAAVAQPGEILASAIVKDLTAGSGIEFRAREPMPLKGLDGIWQLYAAEA